MKGGPSRAPQRSLLRALGLSDMELTRPFIGVVCSKSDYIPGHKHLGEIAEAVKAGIRNAGGVPFEFVNTRFLNLVFLFFQKEKNCIFY